VAAGELAGSDVGPFQGNMWHSGAIRLTPSRLVVVAGLGRAPASGSDETAAARPRSHGFRRGEGAQMTMCDLGSCYGS
jgi:hypothetical protein